ncbi:MAG: hypothetical protein ACPLIG_07025 [Candidatus Bathyarchaeales archaeon]
MTRRRHLSLLKLQENDFGENVKRILFATWNSTFFQYKGSVFKALQLQLLKMS